MDKSFFMQLRVQKEHCLHDEECDSIVHGERVAVVGIAGRFPDAADCDEFWENLRTLTSSIREVPSERWDISCHYSSVKRDLNKTVSKWGGYIADVDKFDPIFFGISPKEAKSMDPQQRILLELAWSCLEDAGYTQEALTGSRTGAFIGVMNFDYRERLSEVAKTIEGHISTGVYTALIPNRISHFFDWHGPSMPIDTACSSSLVALHQAIHSLLRGECDQALAGGVSVLCSPTHYISFSKTGMLSPDGLCRTFDDSAKGYVRGEGAGLVMLKRLQDAIDDDDRIYGVIRGSAVNHGGQARTVTYPNPQAQADVIATAYERAGIPPGSISYIEAHGTGTPKGDPIEINGLKAAFARLAEYFDCKVEPYSCGLGSLKANVGHLEPVAGIAGIIKVLLAMKHRTLPGLAHFQRLNHRIDLTDSPFFIVDKTQDWPARQDAAGHVLPRRAGVSSFGFGGVNAHVVIEEWTGGETIASDGNLAEASTLIVLSAKNDDRLHASAQQLLDWLRRPHSQPLCLPDIAYTLQVGRSAMEERLGIVARSLDELERKLEAFVSGAAEKGDLYRGSALPQDQDAASPVPLLQNVELIADGQNREVVQFWVKGGAVDWKSLYSKRKPKRISLPGYPFARESYWLPGNGGEQKNNGHPIEALQCETMQTASLWADTKTASSGESTTGENGGGSAAPGPATAADVMCFEERWTEQPLSAETNRPVETLICFASREETRQALTDFVQATDQRIQLVFVADAASEGAQAHTATETVASGDPKSFQKLFERLKVAYGKADAVLYWWPLEEPRYISNFSPLACLVQAIGKSRMPVGALMLAAQGDDGQKLCYWEALIGLERSASMVLPNTEVAVIYNAAGQPVQQDDLRWWAETTWSELRAEKIQSSLYRNDKRHVCRVEPITVSTAPPVLRNGGTYLITGGMGGLGYLFAEHLVRNHAARIVLTGRSPLDEAKQKKLDILKATGDVLYWQVDVCDEAGMRVCLEALKARLGMLHGVIHAAGAESWQSLHDNDLATFLSVLEPKVRGTLVLDEVLRDEPLDFLCHFSSSSAIIGDLGACSYAIGNRFQMAHARWRQERRGAGKTLAINWPLWNGGGMQIGDAQSTEFYLKSTSQRMLEAHEGKLIFETLLGQQGPQYLVMCGVPAKIQHLLKLDGGGVAVSAMPTEALQSEDQSEIPLLTRVEDDLLDMASRLLHVERERLALDRNLAGFGFDSINMAAFSATLSSRYSIEVVPSIFFSFPTLGRLARHFTEQHREAVEACYREVAETMLENGNHTGEEAEPVSRSPANQAEETSTDDPIAVIGMSGRFPGARSIAQMWNILTEGRNAITSASADRHDGWTDSYYRCGFVPGVSEFDPLFFEISPREADSMDPKQRLLLEETWKALEDAGYGAAQLSAGCVGIFTGVEDGDYQRLDDSESSITSNHNGILAGRLAYHLDVTGPVLSINTACSSGLVALHQACQSLRNDECDTAIVAAANLFLTPYICRQMDEAGMLSPDGTCYAFDERANGLVPGEAVAVLVLKRLSQAKASNDRIHAIIAGSGVNSDGRTNGITAPNGISQTRLIESVYRKAAIDPEQIEYVVAHGTGTKLGDPVEVNAIIEAFRSFTQRSGYCAITSPKTNLGHTLAASGLVGVISLIEAIRHETIPASLYMETPNPFIQLQGSPFFVNVTNRQWPPSHGRARMGAVSSFGMSGTNAHVVVQEYAGSEPERTSAEVSLPSYLFVLSAKTEKALKRKIADMIAVFEACGDDSATLADISYTLLERRHHFKHRAAFVADSAGEAVRTLQVADGQALTNYFSGKAPVDFRPHPVLQGKAEILAAQYPASNGKMAQFRESLCKLASLYCQGYAFSVAALTEPSLPKVVSLPEYPFSRERHWIRSASSDELAGAVQERLGVSQEPSSTPIKAINGKSGSETLLLSPVWEPVNGMPNGNSAIPEGRFVVAGQGAQALDGIDDRDVLRLQTGELAATETIIRRISAHGWIDHVIWHAPHHRRSVLVGGDGVIQDQEEGVLECFRLIKALLTLGYGERELNWYVITERSQAISAGDVIDAAHSSLHGLIGSLAKEHPNWKIRLADVPSINAVPLSDLLALPPDRRGHAQVYRYGEWYRRHLVPVHPVGEHRAPYRRGGVYIVIGGAGDIGAAWSEHMIARHGAKIIWVGRREKDTQIEARLERLARIGTAPHYFRADAGKLDELQALRSAVLSQYGAIHGVIHAAMVFGNHDLADMTESQFKAALYAKVNVSVRLAQTFGHDPLDFLLFFSSMISLIKNPRQAHYAAGCTFNDAFAHQLAQNMSCPVKVVNWGYWAAEKNAMAQEVRQLNELGVGLIEPGDGMRALDVLLGSPLPQLGVMQLTDAFEVEGMSNQETIDLYPAPKAPDLPDAPSRYGLLGGL